MSGTRVEITVDGETKHFEMVHSDGASVVVGSTDQMYVDQLAADYYHGAVVLTNSYRIWEGAFEKRTNDPKLYLCVKAPKSDGTASYVRWAEIPAALSLFDGGYRSLDQHELALVMEDALDFHDQCHAIVHYRDLTDHSSTLGVTLLDMDKIADVDEILIETTTTPSPDLIGRILILQIELFEVTYFIATIPEEIEDRSIICSLTNHAYISERRPSRRYRLPTPITVDGIQVNEVSDFGMKVTDTTHSVRVKDRSCKITFNADENHALNFYVVWQKPIDEQSCEYGLKLTDDDKIAKKIWQKFVQNQMYPLLAWRDPSRYEDLFTLYRDTGYASAYGKRNNIADYKDGIAAEWHRVDAAGPELGTTVIGYDEDKAVASIGVCNLANGCVIAQAAAIVNDPKYLPITRNIYAWRTRAILMQPDSTHHLAIFDRDKRFLDRFFRKFYLQRGAKNTQRLSWHEWISGTCWTHGASSTQPQQAQDQTRESFELEDFHQLVTRKDAVHCQTQISRGLVELVSRPYLHISQICTGIWAYRPQTGDVLKHFASAIKDNHPYFVFWGKDEESFASMTKSEQPVVEHGWNVVWLCHRTLLPFFLSNSLKSLELMSRKYGTTVIK